MRTVFFLLAIILLGCTDTSSGRWLVTKQTELYANPNGNRIATLQPESICTKGDFSYGKVDRYTKVNCGKLAGWIIEDENLREVTGAE
jgi:hypothetical protein